MSTISAAHPTSFLFVPGSRPDRYAKALASEADEVIVDLEDAVAVEDKDTARQHLVDALEAGLERGVFVRINSHDSHWQESDLAALEALSPAARQFVVGVVVPKAESAEQLTDIAARIANGSHPKPVIALIETARGLANAASIASADGTARLAMGSADLSFDLDIDSDSATLDWAYSQLVVASRQAELDGPIGSPAFEINDLEAVAVQARHLRSLGVTAQLAIHPGQLEAIHAGFAPKPEHIEWAEKVMAVEGDGAAQVDGQMIDKPLRERAARILARAGRH